MVYLSIEYTLHHVIGIPIYNMILKYLIPELNHIGLSGYGTRMNDTYFGTQGVHM